MQSKDTCCHKAVEKDGAGFNRDIEAVIAILFGQRVEAVRAGGEVAGLELPTLKDQADVFLLSATSFSNWAVSSHENILLGSYYIWHCFSLAGS